MLAYHGQMAIKAKYLARVAEHKAADAIIKGQYWQNGRGCAVGCTIHSSNHASYEEELGIPEMLARLEDTIFEGLPLDEAKEWPERFLKAISPGADLSRVGYQFMYWNLTENLVLKDSADKEVQVAIIQCREAVKQCAEAICPLVKGQKADENALSAARSAAESAERLAAESAERLAAESAESAESAERLAARLAAWSAARSAAWSAWSAESAESAERSAAWSAARSAESAARSAAWTVARSAESAESAARSAAWSARSAAWSARSAEWSAAYTKMANKLIKLLEDAA